MQCIQDLAQAMESAGERQPANWRLAIHREPGQRLGYLVRLESFQLAVGKQLTQRERIGVEQAAQIGSEIERIRKHGGVV